MNPKVKTVDTKSWNPKIEESTLQESQCLLCINMGQAAMLLRLQPSTHAPHTGPVIQGFCSISLPKDCRSYIPEKY